MAPPYLQGSVGEGRSCSQRTSLMLPKRPSKLGFLQHSHPLCDITDYHPNYFRATPSIPTGSRCEALGKGKINVHCIYLAHWGGWRQGCASRCAGRAWRGSIRPLSIGSSHCLTQYGCIGSRVSSVSDHPSNGWERPKQAGWEFSVRFRVWGVG